MSALSQPALAHEANQDLPLAAESASVFDDATERQMAAVELRLNFCAQLKAARERKGISLQEISDATKISESIFADFERCDVSRWPLGIYRRAFFRGYAGLIGLPPESTVGEFVRLFPEDLDPESRKTPPGPLRLTMARDSWARFSLVQAQAAALDAAIALV